MSAPTYTSKYVAASGTLEAKEIYADGIGQDVRPLNFAEANKIISSGAGIDPRTLAPGDSITLALPAVPCWVFLKSSYAADAAPAPRATR